ncbi:MAG: anthranilate synthase component I [Chloroflexi bacterium]|nr:anthranilate synthase component I [Chloroflexota bacterium]
MYTPTLEQVKTLAQKGNLIPVYREINADLETPVAAYLKIARGRYSFFLESVEGGERQARYSFLGTEPRRVLITGPGTKTGAVDPLSIVEQELSKYRYVPAPGLPRFLGGAIGYLAYETVHYAEPRVPVPDANPQGVPEAVLMFTDTLLVFDHLRHTIKIVSHVHTDGDVEQAYEEAVGRIERLAARLAGPMPRRALRNGPANGKGEAVSNVAPEQYHDIVRRCREYIIAGDIIQVVPSRRVARPTSATPFNIYRALRALNPSPYMYFLHLGDFHIIGASPEALVRVEDGMVYTFPLAGTRARGATPEQDEALALELRADEKERAEHIMLVDLGRNDLGRICQPGSVQATDIMRVVRYSHVMHLESEIRGKLRPDRTMFDALRSCLPAGTLAGAPKIRAMEIIAEVERERRGPYGGAVGYFGFQGNMDVAIPIRTILLRKGVAYVQAGGGIVYDSIPEAEHQETVNKAAAPLRAVQQAEEYAT